jgi:hypothetical protein
VITGEISAINNCTNILTNPEGEFRLTASEAQNAFADLSLYTNTESCPMVCPPHLKKWEHRSLVLNPRFEQVCLRTSLGGLQRIHLWNVIATLTEHGWGQIKIS